MRYKHLDIVKGISLIFILMSHSCGFPYNISRFFISYFVPIFFIVSGYLQVDKYSTKEFVSRRVHKLIFPYFGYNFLILVIYYFWHGFNSLKEFLLAIIGIFYSNYCLYYPIGAEFNIFFYRIENSPTWFLTTFFCANILFLIYVKHCDNIIKRIIILFLFIAATQILSHFPIFLPWGIDKAFLGTVFMIIGYEFKKTRFFEFKSNYNTIITLFINCIVAFLYNQITIINPGVNMSIREYGSYGIFSVILFICAGFCGSFIFIHFSKLINHTQLFSLPFSIVGRYGISIMSLHLILFRILDDSIFAFINKTSDLLIYWLVAITRIVLSIGIIIIVHYGSKYIWVKIHTKTTMNRF